MPKRMRMALNDLQRRFVGEYMLDFNAAAAALRAGYSGNDTSGGARLTSHPAVLDEIRRRCLKAQARLEMTGDDVKRGFARIACDPREAKDGGPSWEARISALRELGKLFGMYTSKIQVTGSLTLVDLLLAADRVTVDVAQIEKPTGKH